MAEKRTSPADRDGTDIESGSDSSFDNFDIAGEDLSGIVEDTFDDRLRQWVEESNIESLQPVVYLYKYENPRTGDDKEFVQKWTNEIPDYDTIGLTHGSGRYLIMVQIPRSKTDRKIKSKALRIRIGTRYDRLKAEQDNAVRQATISASGGSFAGSAPVSGLQPLTTQSDSLNHAFGMMKDMFSMFMPLLIKSMQPAPMAVQNQNPADMNLMMMQSAKMIQDMAKNNARDIAQFTREIVSQNINPQTQLPAPAEREYEDMPPQNPPTFIEQIMPVVAQLLPALIAGGPKAALTAGAVNAMPQVQQVLQNKEELKKFVDAFDKKIGKEQVDKVLKSLKVNRPE